MPASKTGPFAATADAPQARRKPQTLLCGQHEIVDDYAWLRASNWRDVLRDPATLPDDIRAHLQAENAYADAVMADTDTLQERLQDEMRARIRQDDSTVPMEDGAYAYFEFYRKGAEHPVYARRTVGARGRPGAEPQILLDADALAKSHDYFDLGGIAHSPDHRYLACALDVQGSEFYQIRILDLRTGETLPERLDSATPDLAWSTDGTRLYWVWRDAQNRPCEVRCHCPATLAAADRRIYREPDPGFFLSLDTTSDGRFVLIEAHDHHTSEVRALAAGGPDAAPVLFAPRQPGVEYHVDHAGGRFFFLTNADGAEDFKIMCAPDDAPQRPNWRDFIAVCHGVRRLQQRLFVGFHVRLERENALTRLRVKPLGAGAEYEVALDEPVCDVHMMPLLDFETTRFRYGVSTMAQPRQIYDYDLKTKRRKLRKCDDVPGGHDATAFRVERLMATAPDGAQVPVSLVCAKDMVLDGRAPLLLYGYGAYGITVEPGFSARRLSLLERGFVFAIAHVRGGEAKGHAWYTAARGAGKTHTFTDFIAVARTLAERGYSTAERTIAMGGSAGGLLIGAALNMAPECFGGAIAAVPFVDVLQTMCDDSLPLTPPEWPEWGNPRADEAAFAAIAGYSPCDNVHAAPYPPLLVTSGLTDPRVTYWEPAKWVARLRHAAPQAGPYVLKMQMHAGHGGASGRFAALQTIAMEYAFAIKAAGLACQ